jgi:hypothetical protein
MMEVLVWMEIWTRSTPVSPGTSPVAVSVILFHIKKKRKKKIV